MNNEFESLFDQSILPEIINKSKTVSKEECRGNLISKNIWTSDNYENELLTVNCIRDLYGLAIVRFK